MTRYFIDLRDTRGIVRDKEGAEFGHIEDALDEAKASARDLAKQYIDSRVPLSDTCVEVRNAKGQTVAALTVSEVLSNPVHPEFKNNCSEIPASGHR